jgi:hypothetical protein
VIARTTAAELRGRVIAIALLALVTIRARVAH